MRKIILVLFVLSLLSHIISCDKVKTDTIDFHKVEDRIGIWVNTERRDTLDFINYVNLVRKGDLYSFEEYLYRIVGDTLFIGTTSSNIETQHVFTDLDGNSVIIGNMFPAIEFVDNSEIFAKLD